MTILENILIILSSLLDQALPLLLFWLVIQPNRDKFHWSFYGLCVGVFTIFCCLLSFSDIHYLVKTAWVVLLKIFYCWTILEHKFAISLFLPVVDLVSMYACESSVPFVLALLFPHVSFSDVSDTSFLMVFGILESRSLLYLLWGGCILLLYRRKPIIHPRAIHTSQWIALCSGIGFLASFVVAFQWVANLHPEAIHSILGAFPIIFLIITILFFLLALSLSSEAERKYRLENELLQAEQQLEQQKAVSSMYEQIRGAQHDFRNHMQIIASLAEQQNDTEVVNYVKDILGSLAASSAFVNTGVPAVDALMNSKFIYAKKHNIQVSAEICFPEPLTITISDLCAALFNLLDNAIEACEKNQLPENRWLELTLHQADSFLVIRCSNPSEVRPTQGRNGFRTSKPGARHGIGMKQLQRVANRYSGFFHATYQNGIFTAKLALSQGAKVEHIHASYINTEEAHSHVQTME